MHEHINAPTKEPIPNIKDPLEAEEFIEDLWEKGERPIVTVPIQYKEYIKEGLKPHSTWIQNLSVIVGTFGRESYLPNNEDEERLILEVDVSLEQIKPRFTGPDKAFRGVVGLDGPIPPEKITVH